MTDVFNALPAGYELLEYRIECMLGVGGFGLTYLAHDTNLNTKVAIKEYLPADFASRGEDQSVDAKSADVQPSFDWGLKRFLDESRTLASFRHPNIVRVMRFFEANRTAYMVMEFIAGQPLNEWVKQRGSLDEAGLVRIAAPLLDGLEVIHAAGYLHRDIKPPNIFMREDGNPILIDFGSARMKANVDQELTAIVTPGFAPLEQYHAHGRQGPWTDLYSLSGVLYWLVTGRKPVEAAARVREDIMPSARIAGEHKYYSTEFLDAIDWALNPDEQQRPQSAAAWRARLITGKAADMGRTLPLAPTVLMPAGATTVSGTSMPTGVTLDRQALKLMETDLARHVGPIAAVVIRTAAKKSGNLGDVARAVAGEIPDERLRAVFLRKHASEGNTVSMPVSAQPSSPLSGSGSVNSSAVARFAPEILQRAESALAQHIGAVAKVVVRRAASRARDESELYLLLADEIDDPNEKKSFIRKAIALSGKA